MNSPVKSSEQSRSGGGEAWRSSGESAQREIESWHNRDSSGHLLRSPDQDEKKGEVRGGSVSSSQEEGSRPDERESRIEDRVSRMEDRRFRMEDRRRLEDRGSRMEDRGLRMEPSHFSPPRLRNRSTTPDEEDSTSFHETYEREMVRRRRGNCMKVLIILSNERLSEPEREPE